MPTDSASFGLQVIEHLQQTIDEMVRQLHRQNDWLNPRVQSLARLYLATLRQYLHWSRIVNSSAESPAAPRPQKRKTAPLSNAAFPEALKSTPDNAPHVNPKLARITPASPTVQSSPFPAPGLLRSVPQLDFSGVTSLESSPIPGSLPGKQCRTG
ncbi:MAG: hypothetical protein ACE15F_09125 [bacterium]